MDAVKEVSEASDKTIENIESISWQVVQGSAQAAKELSVETDKFMGNAINGIKKGLEQIQPETSDSFYRMYENISDQIKETTAQSLETVNDEIKKLSKRAKDIFSKK
jgi:gas vesicle protein